MAVQAPKAIQKPKTRKGSNNSSRCSSRQASVYEKITQRKSIPQELFTSITSKRKQQNSGERHRQSIASQSSTFMKQRSNSDLEGFTPSLGLKQHNQSNTSTCMIMMPV
jgi:hypothetical protein